MAEPISQINGASEEDKFLRMSTGAWLLLIVMLGTALRLYHVGRQSIWYDEGFTLAFAKRLDWSLSFLSKDLTTDAVLLPFLMRGWMGGLHWIPDLQAGTETYDGCLRLVPCLFSVMAIPLTFLLCLAIWNDRRTALLAAFFCAISPFQIYYSQELKPYSLLLLLSLAMAFCAVRALDTDCLRYWFGITVFTTLSLYAHFFSVWNIAMLNLYFLLTVRRHWRKLGKWTLAQGVALVLCLPALFFILELSAIYESFPAWFERPTLKSGFISFKTFFAGYSPNTVAYWGLFLLAGALFVGGLVALRKNRERLVLILLLTVLPIVGNVVVWRLRQFPFYEHRVFIFSAAVSYGVVAYGIRRLRPEVLKPIVVVVLCALMAPCLADYYAQRLHPLIAHRMGVRYKVAIREAAAYVAAHLDDGDLVGHSCNCTSFPFQYYLPGARQQTLCITKEESLAGGPFTPVLTRYGIRPIEVETAIDDAKRLWLVESWWEPFDLPPNLLLLRARLDGHLIREDRQAFDGVTVYRYRTNAGRLSNLRTTESWIPTPGRLRITGGKTVP